MSFTQSSQIIETVKNQLGLNVDFFTILKIWDKLVNINDVDICGYKNGTIYASTPSSVSSSDINLRKRDIIDKMNQYLGERKIKNIKIIIGE
ncbi:MAG: DciA family protein [Elusimicrobiota bacterium]|jgi:hypothetical protein|nr:DciA family protein [Elusimicrobiota bacterium]